MKRLVFMTLIILSVGLPSMGARQAMFRSAVLSGLAGSIGYVPADTLAAGAYDAGNVQGRRLVVEYDDRHKVTHLGFRLFSDEMKSLYDKDVYRFLERYFLELVCWKDRATLEQKMADDKVYFTCGNVADIGKVDDKALFTISRMEDKYYVASWSHEDKVFLEVAFPISYELLLGMSKAEMEQMMPDAIYHARPFVPSGEMEALEQFRGNVFRTVPVRFYQLESLNTCTYYYEEKDSVTLVMDSLNCECSVTNLFHAVSVCNNPMKVSQALYGYRNKEYIVTLRQWLDYCHEAGLTVYTAIEDEYEDGYKVLLVAECKDLGYNHLLSVLVPKDFLTHREALFEVKMNVFIPTYNLKNLYRQYTGKSTKKIY